MGKERKLGVQEKAPGPFRQSDTSPLAMARRMLSQFLLQTHHESSLGSVGNREETWDMVLPTEGLQAICHEKKLEILKAFNTTSSI